MDIKKIIDALTRPYELDRDLEETRKATRQAEEVLRQTRATLDGEEAWFKGGNKEDE